MKILLWVVFSVFLALTVFSYCYWQDGSNIKKSVEDDVSSLNIEKLQEDLKSNLFFNSNEIEYTMKLKAALSAFHDAEQGMEQYRKLNKFLDTNSPTLRELATKIIKRYGESKVYIDSVIYNGTEDFNYSFYYLKGCIYYRHLTLLSGKDDAKELFDQCLKSFKESLKYKPKDVNAIINIELLLNGRTSAEPHAGKNPNIPQFLPNSGNWQGPGSPKGQY